MGSMWNNWLDSVPLDQQDVLYKALLSRRSGHIKSAQEVAEEAGTNIKVTRISTDDLLVTNPPPYIDIFELHPIYRRIAFDSNLLLKGPKGDGKSLSVITYAAQECIPIIIQECSEDTKKNDLQGSQFLIGTETIFSLGCIPAAIDVANEMGKCILLFEEMNALTPQVQKQLNAVTDFRKMSSLPHIGKTYKLREGAQLWVVGTMNPTVYGGTYDLNEDLKSRFEELEITYPMSGQEKKILGSLCGPACPDTTLDLILQLAKETRQGKTGYALSTRDLDRLVRNVAKVGLNTALQMMLCKFEGLDRGLLITRLNSLFGNLGWKKFWGERCMSTINVTVPIDLDDILEVLSDLPDEDVVKFVKALDEKMADWDFTEALHEHFAALHEDYLREVAEDGEEEDEDADENDTGSETTPGEGVWPGYTGTGDHPGPGNDVPQEANHPGVANGSKPPTGGGDPGPTD